jgi:hypothetical protein
MFDYCSIEPHDDGIVIIRLLRSATFKEMASVLDHLASKEWYRQRLYDIRDVEITNRVEDLIRIVDYGKKVFPKPNRCAWVANLDLSFGLARLTAGYREQPEVCHCGVFKSMDEAYEWLLAESAVIT